MSAVRTNNITGQNSDDQKTICVLFSSSGSSYAATDPSKVSSSVKPGKTYTVETNNSKADDGEIKGDGSDTGISESDASYYTSGYIRIICIKEKLKEQYIFKNLFLLYKIINKIRSSIWKMLPML